MRVWTIVNQKGGVGKTTTVVNLAGILRDRGQRVLMVDTDPHGSLGYYLGLDPEELPGSLFDLFYYHTQIEKSRIQSCIVPTNVPGLDLLPSATALATLDQSLGKKSGMGLILKEILSEISDQYDYVLIDCPPVLGVLMVNALAACEQIIIPVQTEFLALKGLDRMIGTLERMGHGGGAQPNYIIVPTMFDRRTKASLLALSNLARQHAERLWHSVVPVDTKLRDASLAHLPTLQFAGHTRGVTAYTRLLDELLEIGNNHVTYRPASGQ